MEVNLLMEPHFEEDELENAFWFYAESKTEVTESNKYKYPRRRKVGDVFNHPYIACIKNGEVYVWDSVNR